MEREHRNRSLVGLKKGTRQPLGALISLSGANQKPSAPRWARRWWRGASPGSPLEEEESAAL